MNKVQKVYFCEYNNYIDENGKEYCKCNITTNKKLAKKLAKSYRLATKDEVEEFIGLGYEPIPVIEVSDGIFGWFEKEYITQFGDEEYFCGYVFMQPNSEWEIRDLARYINSIKMSLHEQ